MYQGCPISHQKIEKGKKQEQCKQHIYYATRSGSKKRLDYQVPTQRERPTHEQRTTTDNAPRDSLPCRTVPGGITRPSASISPHLLTCITSSASMILCQKPSFYGDGSPINNTVQSTYTDRQCLYSKACCTVILLNGHRLT